MTATELTLSACRLPEVEITPLDSTLPPVKLPDALTSPAVLTFPPVTFPDAEIVVPVTELPVKIPIALTLPALTLPEAFTLLLALRNTELTLAET